MIESSIHQIYYSEQTRLEMDPGFTPLDNSANDRPDWREYWPMRRFLLARELAPEFYYGFFSPKFRLKTSLTATAVQDFIRQQDGAADVISFSPFFDEMAFPLNIMEVAAAHHGCRDVFVECAALIAPRFDIDRSVMSSLDTVYCNYFIAKPRFWKEWLRHCERIFEIAEDGLTPLGRRLNAVVNYGTGTAPAKVFVIERLASLILWSQPEWVVKSYDPLKLPPLHPNRLATVTVPDLLVLNALKIAHRGTGAEQYLTMYRQLRERLSHRQPTAGGSAANPAPTHPQEIS
jgi:hypothetical protein